MNTIKIILLIGITTLSNGDDTIIDTGNDTANKAIDKTLEILKPLVLPNIDTIKSLETLDTIEPQEQRNKKNGFYFTLTTGLSIPFGNINNDKEYLDIRGSGYCFNTIYGCSQYVEYSKTRVKLLRLIDGRFGYKK